MRNGKNDDLFQGHLFGGRHFQFGKAKRLPMVQWMRQAYLWYSYYTHTAPDWGDQRWHELFKAGRTPLRAVHEFIDGPEYEFEPDDEIHADADVIDARAAVGGRV